jgi:AcrR family transcriptional regulator
LLINRRSSIKDIRQLSIFFRPEREYVRRVKVEACITDKPEPTDRRILRSRRMLMDALVSLLKRKNFSEISIQEIAEEANLNRATFYLHYPDKNALLQALTATRFQELIAKRNLSFTDCDAAVRAIALGVCDYLAEVASDATQLAQLPLEDSIIPVVEGMFRQGGAGYAVAEGMDRELLATTAAWALFGVARRWSLTQDRIPAEEIANMIKEMVKPILLAGFPDHP